MKKIIKFACLNPKCPFPQNQVFLHDNVQLHKKCQNRKLCFNIEQLGNWGKIDNQNCYLDRALQINFQNEGILAVEKILKLKKWPQQLNVLFEQLKIRVNQDIDNKKQEKLKQFEQIYLMAESIEKEIKDIAREGSDNQDRFANLSKKMEQMSNIYFVSFLQIQKIRYTYEKNVRSIFQKIANLIQTKEPNFDQLNSIRKRNAIQKAKQVFFQNNDILINDKIQKLTSLFKMEMIKTTFNSNVGLYQATCWMCKSICYSPKEDPTRLACLHQFLMHLTTMHQTQVYSAYMSTIPKCEFQQINLSLLSQKVQTEQIDEVILIDRENSGAFQKPLQLSKGKLWVQVINKDNKNLARGLFIVADSKRKDASDILMTMIAYELVKSGVKKVTVVTKDHFGVTLQELINNSIGHERLECIEPKDLAQRMEQVLKNEMRDS